MTPRATTYVALLNIFLLMSVHPINAMRISEVEHLGVEISKFDETLRQLQKAMREHEAFAARGNANSTGAQADQWWLWATCADHEKDFNTASAKVLKGLEESEANGRVSMLEGASLILKSHDAAKALVAAQEQKCAWTTDKSANTDVLKAIGSKTFEKNPCKAKAEEVLRRPGGDDKLKLEEAMEALLSRTCEASPVRPSGNVAPKGEAGLRTFTEETDIAADGLAEKLLDQADKADQARAKNSTGSMLQKDSFLQMVSGLEEGMTLEEIQERSGFDDIIFKGLGYIFLLILWLFVCTAFLWLASIFLGLILCTLKSIIASFINIFKSDAWISDWASCLSWWAFDAGRHGTGGGDLFCALSYIR